MRRHTIAIALLVAASVAWGCAHDAHASPSKQPEKAEFVSEMKEDLDKIQAESDRLSAKIERSSGTAKAEAKDKLARVQEKWAEAKKDLARAEDATESTWNDVRDRAKKSYKDLETSFDDTRQWLSDKNRSLERSAIVSIFRSLCQPL